MTTNKAALDVIYTATDAVHDGVLVPLFNLGVKVYFEKRPITFMTSNLFDELRRYNSGGSIEAQAAAYTSMVAFIVKGAKDTAGPGEHRGVLYQAADQHALGNRKVWLEVTDTSEYDGVPGSDGGWTLMFADDR